MGTRYSKSLQEINSREQYNKYLHEVINSNSKVGQYYHLLMEDDSKIESVIQDGMLSPKEFIEVIALCRKVIYNSATGGSNKAAENETDRLYARNPWKFIEEFLQNADDCSYNQAPSVRIVIDECVEHRPAIEFIYNEEGFQRSDVWAITAFSESTKVGGTVKPQEEEGVFYWEKTGRKGRGFKSVFSLKAENVIVHIRSNGFSFKLDRRIGRILPVWEDDQRRMDGLTHVIVELVNPEFEVKEVYPEFRRLFCVDDCESIFEKSPFLFMHRLRHVCVERLLPTGKNQFSTEYEEDAKKTECLDAVILNPEKRILAGIRDKDTFYRKQYQTGRIVTNDDGKHGSYPIIRYTEMIEDEDSYRNYSIIAPLILKDTQVHWSTGALFRTFPLSQHHLDIPLAIDAPFILNLDRSGILYSNYREEENQNIPANIWNSKVSDQLFKREGVLESFYLWARTVPEICMDQYIPSTPIVLFDDRNNNDDHDGRWIPIVDVSNLCQSIPVFRLSFNSNKYTDFKHAWLVDHGLFAWPHVSELFALTLGSDYKKCLVSDFYCGSKLLKEKPIIRLGFIEALNQYLDIAEAQYNGNESAFYKFIESSLYPYILRNEKALSAIDSRAILSIRMYLSTVQMPDSIEIVREAFTSDKTWLHSQNGKVSYSINRYRIVESSPIHTDDIMSIVESRFPNEIRKISDIFDTGARQKSGVDFPRWEPIRDYIEAAKYYGYSIKGLTFDMLRSYVLSESLDSEFNPFRNARLFHIIPDEDVHRFARYFGGDVSKAAKVIKDMGTKRSDAFLKERGNYLVFLSETMRLFRTENCTVDVLDMIKREKEKLRKNIDTKYTEIRESTDTVLLYLLDSSHKMLTSESYVDICNGVQENAKYWKRSDPNAAIILIRACARASKSLSHNAVKKIKISLQDVLENHLGMLIERLVKQNCLTVQNNGYFSEIPEQEINALLTVLSPGKTKTSLKYYKGDLKKFNDRLDFLSDGSGGHVYLHADAQGDYKNALEKSANKKFNPEYLKYHTEMQQQYHDVKESIIVPIFDQYEHDLERAYKEIESRFEEYSNRQIISILSWFRYSGYSNALGNGNIQNEREIEDDYRREPWKFVYEFIQNIDDCSFGSVDPELTITIDRNKCQVIFEYNELGFSLEDVKALTKFGDSNKRNQYDQPEEFEGVFNREKTGRKGRGFKSVFALPGNGIVVHIQSNGFSFKFVKCLGYIIPIWEEGASIPVTGTRLTIEGLSEEYTDKLEKSMKGLLGIENLEEFFAVCPVLYLRKLNKLAVHTASDSFSIEIKTFDQQFAGSALSITSYDHLPVAGIMHNGSLYQSVWEQQQITICENGLTNAYDCIRYSYMWKNEDNGLTQLLSVTAPFLTDDTELLFINGSLFRTLPLDGHKFCIPMAINLPFKTNSGRSALEDMPENWIASHCIILLLRKFFSLLRSKDGIRMDRFIPTQRAVLFSDIQYIQTLDLKKTIAKIDILRSFAGETYISCENAIRLPAECYLWPRPDILCECFGFNAVNLISGEYSSHIVDEVNLITEHFAEYLNRYLNRINQNNTNLIPLLQNHIYPFIAKHFEQLNQLYLSKKQPDALKGLKVYIFQMADGSVVRETADDKTIWIKDAPAEYRSFGRYRCLAASSIANTTSDNSWINELHSSVSFSDAFSNQLLKTKGVENWEQAAQIIATLLYYHVDLRLHIPYLNQCVLAEDLDCEPNLFRSAYSVSGNHAILKHVITIDDIEGILSQAGLQNEIGIEQLVEEIRGMGLRQPDDFFTQKHDGLFTLNENTLAILRDYCQERDNAFTAISEIASAFSKLKTAQSSKLHLHYSDLKYCKACVFSAIFSVGLVHGDTKQNLANEFCKEFIPDNSLISKEAFFRAAQIAQAIPGEYTISISLSDILKLDLGACIQSCKLRFDKSIHLSISPGNIRLEAYPSQAIDRALSWMDDEQAISKSYEYYLCDLTEYSALENNPNFFLFDDTKVILNASNPESSLLSFIKERYKGKGNSSFREIVDIAAKQSELKGNWKRTKKEYVEELQSFRKNTSRQLKLLCPDYDRHLNDATGNAVDYILPELLQNINDCPALPEQSKRVLRVAISLENGTMMLCYDEAGFDYGNVYSITAIGQSTKHDKSEGEKGLGFKKVFSLFNSVDIYSNGFYFRLCADANTVPTWIEDREQNREYIIPGKTVMLFSVTEQSRKGQLKRLRETLVSLMDGRYTNTLISPIFLKNIDEIHLDGYDKHYSKETMRQKFIFKTLPLIDCYRRLNTEAGVSIDMGKTMAELKTRRKFESMSTDEVENYLQSLSVDICIPKAINSMGEGQFYSTLPTTESTQSGIYINLPLELSTGRDGIVDNSEYNRAVFRMLFSPIGKEKSVFTHALEEIADENRDLFMLNYLSFSLRAFIGLITQKSGCEEQGICTLLDHICIFTEYRGEKMVSTNSAYSVDSIICQYCAEVPPKMIKKDIGEWISEHSVRAQDLDLILPKSKKQCNTLEEFARTVDTCKGYYPLSEIGHDLVVEYFKDEYGCQEDDE